VPSCIPSNMFFALYAYDSKRWNGTPIAKLTGSIPNNITWNNIQDVYNYFGLANPAPASTTIDLTTPNAWVPGRDTAIAPYTTFTGISAPPNGQSTVAVVGYNATTHITAITRTIATAGKINLASYATLTYSINQSSDGVWGESPAAGDDVYLEYSPDNITWTQLSKTVVGSIGINKWNTVSVAIPAGAKPSSGVYLRYRQTSSGSLSTGRYDDSFAVTSVVATAAATSLIPTSWCTRSLAYLEFPTSGTWTIYVTYNHAVWLWLNQKIVLNIDDAKNPTTSSFTISATAGTKYAWQLDMEHEEILGFGYPYESIIKWSGPGVSQPTIIPATAFCYDPSNPPPATAVVDQVNS